MDGVLRNAAVSVTLDIDDTCDVAHGHQQLSLFNAHYDERCFLPIHVYDTEKSRPVAVVLRPGKTPSGVEVRAHLRRLVRRIRSRWPTTRILFRGDSHYARPEAMTWCEDNGVDYVFGLPGTKPLSKKVDETADDVRTERALVDKDVVRGWAETRHRAGSWHTERRAVARIEATRLGLDIRFIVTNLDHGSAEWLYRKPLLRARAGGESHQAAQDPAFLRSHVVPLGARQPSPPCSAHRRLLADARRPRRHSESARPCESGIRDIAPEAAQDRRPRRRNGQPRPSGLRRRMSRGRSLCFPTRCAHAARTLSDGAKAPLAKPSPQTRSKVRVSMRRKNRTTNRVRLQPALIQPDDQPASRIDQANALKSLSARSPGDRAAVAKEAAGRPVVGQHRRPDDAYRSPSCTSLPPRPPMSVLTQPGQTLLTSTPVPASSARQQSGESVERRF